MNTVVALTVANIYFQPSLDSTDHTKEWFDDFETRINASRTGSSPIKVKRHRFEDPGSQSQGDLTSGSEGAHGPKKINEHDWLITMDTFADAIKDLPEPHTFLGDLAKRPLPGELTKDVTVALIDDGVDYMHPVIRKNLLPGKSFDSGLGSHDALGAPEPYHESTTGHGTFMAYMIRRVCPAVKIFVYKIDALKRENQSTTFNAKSAADVSNLPF